MFGKIWHFEEKWVLYELEISVFGANAGIISSLSVHSYKDTTEVFVPLLKRRIIAVAWNLFHEYSTIELSAVYSCHIAEYDSIKIQVLLLGKLCGLSQLNPVHSVNT